MNTGRLLTVFLTFVHLLAARAADTATLPTATQIQTATTHPMKYLVSLPKNWSPARQWPVLVAPSAHYDPKGSSLALFAAQRDAKGLSFITVAPFVINADPVARMGEYRGEDKVFIAGFSSSTHIAYIFLFAHPELLAGAVINSGVYLGRGVDEDHLPRPNSPERAAITVKFIVGESDPGSAHYSENWAETKAKLLRCGHPESQLQAEVITKANAENLGAGHQWYPTRILDFCTECAKRRN